MAAEAISRGAKRWADPLRSMPCFTCAAKRKITTTGPIWETGVGIGIAFFHILRRPRIMCAARIPRMVTAGRYRSRTRKHPDPFPRLIFRPVAKTSFPETKILTPVTMRVQDTGKRQFITARKRTASDARRRRGIFFL